MVRVQKIGSIALFAVIIAIALVTVGVMANPIPTPLITVESPKNNIVYSSNNVSLIFSHVPAPDHNFTSFSYSLDDQAEQNTDGNTVLTNLTPGSHVLEVYGDIAWYSWPNWTVDHHNENYLLTIVYFSVSYSTAWANFAIVSTAIIGLFSLALFINRRQLIVRLKGEKTGIFWIGLTFAIISSFILIPSLWWHLNRYLFPSYPPRLAISLFPFLIFSLIFMGISVTLMVAGSRSSRNR